MSVFPYDLQSEFLLDRLNSIEEFSESVNPGDLLFHFAQRSRRRAPPNSAIGWKILRDTSLGGNDVAVANLDMSGDSDLAADHDVISDSRTSRDPGLGGDRRMLADDDIVRDLHQVIDLHAVA